MEIYLRALNNNIKFKNLEQKNIKIKVNFRSELHTLGHSDY